MSWIHLWTSACNHSKSRYQNTAPAFSIALFVSVAAAQIRVDVGEGREATAWDQVFI